VKSQNGNFNFILPKNIFVQSIQFIENFVFSTIFLHQ